MKPTYITILSLMLACFLTAVSCQHRDENSDGLVFVDVKVRLNSRSSSMGPSFVQSGSVKTALISAVPESLYPVDEQTDLSDAYDQQLLSLTDNTVTLSVPLETSFYIVKETFASELTLAEAIAGKNYSPYFGVSDALTIRSGTTVQNVEVVMQEVLMVGTIPVDATTDVDTSTMLGFIFSHSMDTTTIDTNEGTTTCSGHLQLSKDDFSSCVGLSNPSVQTNIQGPGFSYHGSNTVFSVSPSSALEPETTYKIRVLGGSAGVLSAEGTELSSLYGGNYTMTTGFTTAAQTSFLLGEGIQGQTLSLSGIVTTLAGSGAYGHTDETGILAVFGDPHDVCTDGTYLYVVDKGQHYIRRIVISTGVVDTIAGTGADGSNNGPGASATFNAPAGITIDGTYLYVADQVNNLIRKIEIGGDWTVSTLAGGATGGGGCDGSDSTCIDDTGTAAQFNWPTGVTYTNGYVYVADMNNNRIRRVNVTSGEVTTVAGDGNAAFAEGTGTAAQFSDPHDLTTDGTNLYVVDQDNNRIRQIVIATGAVTTLVGDGTAASTDGTGSDAQLAEPEGITTDGTYLYFTDWGDNLSMPYETVLRKTEISTGITTTIAGGALGGGGCGGTDDSYCQDGTGSNAQFKWAHDLTTDGTYLYLADFINHRIRKIE